MNKHPQSPRMQLWRPAALALATAVAATTFLAVPSAQANEPADPPAAEQMPAPTPGFPLPTEHTQEAHDPASDFTSKWTRADAKQIMAQSDSTVAPGENSMNPDVTMPEIPEDFPTMNEDVWVWDTWSLTDENANQISYKGWDVIFSLVADRHAGYGFDQRHWNARIGYFFRKTNADPAKDKWNYGGHIFADGASIGNTEWSGSTRLMQGNHVNVFYTATTFYDVAERNAGGGGIAPDAAIAKALGNIHADKNGVTFDGFQHTKLLEPDGKMYQNKAQNPGFAFRDPYTFEDPAHPGKTYMVFEGNTGGTRGEYKCKEEDLGYKPGDPHAENLNEVNSDGAYYQTANVGLAVADNKDLTKWSFLPPILSANCVNDQTERPQIFIQNEGGKNKYYLFTISHQFTYAAGVRGPDGVYGFVGDGIRSDYQPLNNSGLALGSPTDLNLPSESPENPTPQQNGRQFQAYSHYVQPGGLVQSFIDNVNGVRGGSLSPTVKINFRNGISEVDRSFGQNGLGPYGYLPTNVKVGGEGLYK
ncbi:glycoside hydrolase family 68 protein [Arthrobacter rhizosphaerae]|uniref:glycoside hydrolase family 68 protein n=1 Tax=Arthrobacter rhizosphaerae TaxID=2855490 RepID=UPI001FF3E31D|nr:glycoside hydrolase family 68 protein [Arthrobacter rhizosphaerae]